MSLSAKFCHSVCYQNNVFIQSILFFLRYLLMITIIIIRNSYVCRTQSRWLVVEYLMGSKRWNTFQAFKISVIANFNNCQILDTNIGQPLILKYYYIACEYISAFTDKIQKSDVM